MSRVHNGGTSTTWLGRLLCSAVVGASAGAAAAVAPEVPWGTIEPLPGNVGRHLFRISELPPDGAVVVPAGFPQIVRATIAAPGGADVPIDISPDATRIALVVPRLDGAVPPSTLLVESADTTAQFPDGRIVFAAPDATVVGTAAKLETHPGNARIGYWSNPADRVEWTRTATRWGAYDVVLTYSTASRDGTEIEVEVAGVTLPATLPSTGSWYRYRTLALGRAVLPAAGPQPVVVRCTKAAGGAVMNLKAVSLLPACEGAPPVQAEDGSILLHGRDATVLGTTLRWEPAEKKQTLGFWTKPTDRARWVFTIGRPGTFDVEVMQGCGTGQGGSEMRIACDEGSSPPPPALLFTVEDTGHFQNFKPRVVGRLELRGAGEHTLVIGPERIAKAAACDVRQIRLVPVVSPAPAENAAAGRPDLTFPGESLDQWQGHVRHTFLFQGRKAWVVEPALPRPGNPWSWVMMFPDAFVNRCAAPQLLAAGFHHAFLDVGNTFGSPAAVGQLAAFHEELVRRGLARRPALVGISRGCLFAHRFAAEHPADVAVIYGDNGVCDFKSWPGGRGVGKGSPADWKACLAAYGFPDEAAALAYPGNPIDTLAPLAAAGIALIHVVGDADDAVPPAENASLVEERYRKLGGTVELIREPGRGHHPHGLADPAPVVAFIVRHAGTPVPPGSPEPAGSGETR